MSYTIAGSWKSEIKFFQYFFDLADFNRSGYSLTHSYPHVHLHDQMITLAIYRFSAASISFSFALPIEMFLTGIEAGKHLTQINNSDPLR